jgi:protein-disulfide isomerase
VIPRLRFFPYVCAGLVASVGLARSQTLAPLTPAPSGAIVAIVNKQPIYASEVEGYLAAQLQTLRQNMYELQRNMLETLINRTVIESEAKRRGITPDEFRQSVTADVVATDAEIADAYARAAGRSPLGIPGDSELKEQIKANLQAQKRADAFRKAVAELRANAPTEVFLKPPAPLRMAIPTSGPAKGNPRAALTVVEFADFECPYCKQATGTLEPVLREYGDNVRFIYRHMPLPNHRFAFKAAQAAVCADQQGQFWPYHDLLFSRSPELSAASLEDLARSLKLNMSDFAACLSNEDSRAIVTADMKEATRLGVASTPTFFVNGRMVKGAIAPEEFRKILNEEIAERSVTP